jgi:hypothetical protein
MQVKEGETELRGDGEGGGARREKMGGDGARTGEDERREGR